MTLDSRRGSRVLRAAIAAWLCTLALSPAPIRADSIAPPKREPERSRPGDPPERTAPQVRFSRVEVSPGVSPEIVRRILRQSYGRYRLCYEKGLGRNRKLTGTAAMLFDIGLDGRVSAMKDDGSTVPDAKVARCIREATVQLSFPMPDPAAPGRRVGEPVPARVHLLLLPGDGSGRERGSRRPAKP